MSASKVFRSSLIVLLIFTLIESSLSWRYETRCTRTITDPNASSRSQSDDLDDDNEVVSVVSTDDDDDTTTGTLLSSTRPNHLTLRCLNTNDFLFIGLTQYGVKSAAVSVVNRTQHESTSTTSGDSSTCHSDPHTDCLVTVDYLANECNGLNSCRIQLDAQFLHSCKRHSDYLTLAYECIPGAQRVDICSSDETFLIDSNGGNVGGVNNNQGTASTSNMLTRFGAFYLTSPGYPNEYADNLKNCSCRLEYVKIENSPNSILSNTAASSLSSSNNQPSSKSNEEINLALSAYEFDLEEAMSTDSDATLKCNKDYFSIETDYKNETICGRVKEFGEWYARSSGAPVVLRFHSDDFITRRGFLLKIATIAPTECREGETRFDAARCISVHEAPLHEEVSWWDAASRACADGGGRLLRLDSFVDAARLASILTNGKSQTTSSRFWIASSLTTSLKAPHGRKNKKAASKCVSKSATSWHEEKSCNIKRPYICEYDAIRRSPKVVELPAQSQATTSTLNRGMSDTNGNRLIRVSCGYAPSLFGSATAAMVSIGSTTSTTSTTASSETTTKAAIRSNSILNTQRPEKKSDKEESMLAPVILDSIVVDNNKDYDDGDDDSSDDYDDVIVTSTRFTKTTKSSRPSSDNTASSSLTTKKLEKQQQHSDKPGLLNVLTHDYLLIIAVVCGIAVVLIAINLFCIWNYYNKKLHGHFKRHDFAIINDHHEFRQHHSSTLRKSSSSLSKKKLTSPTSNSSSSSTSTTSSGNNRTFTSCLANGAAAAAAGTYIRVPLYDLQHVHGGGPRESTDSGLGGLTVGSSSFKGAATTTAILTPQECLRVLLHGGVGEHHHQVCAHTDQSGHYYETLTKRPPVLQPQSEYHVYNPLEAVTGQQQQQPTDKFDSMVVVPTLQHNQAVVLLATSKPPQYCYSSSAVVYGGGDLASTSYSSAASSSTKPLLSFNVAAAGTTPSSSSTSSTSSSTEIEEEEDSASNHTRPSNI